MTALKKAIDKASELLAKREDENEYHLHDVDRKWVIEAMMDYAEYCLKGKSSQTEISDEEIEKAFKDFSEDWIVRQALEEGAKWYREQLKQRQ
jgi:uncharacterized protein (DUF2344 family)